MHKLSTFRPAGALLLWSLVCPALASVAHAQAPAAPAEPPLAPPAAPPAAAAPEAAAQPGPAVPSADAELARMADGLIAERLAAGREINDDMRRVAAGAPLASTTTSSITTTPTPGG